MLEALCSVYTIFLLSLLSRSQVRGREHPEIAGQINAGLCRPQVLGPEQVLKSTAKVRTTSTLLERFLLQAFRLALMI